MNKNVKQRQARLADAIEFLCDAVEQVSSAQIEISEAVEILKALGHDPKKLSIVVACQKLLASVEEVLDLQEQTVPRTADQLGTLRSVSPEVADQEVPDGRPFVKYEEPPPRFQSEESCGHVESGICGHCQASVLLPGGVP